MILSTRVSFKATDLGKYLQTRSTLFSKLKTFDKRQEESRRALMAVLMTMCDLCETIKPWGEYIQTVVGLILIFALLHCLENSLENSISQIQSLTSLLEEHF